jgi:HK97 family phage portal protein
MRLKQRLANWLTDAKASAVAPLIAVSRLGQAAWTPRKYDKLADEAYVKNVVAYKAINEIITAMGQVPWEVMRVDSNGDAMDAEDSDLAKLLHRPNPQQSGSVFFGNIAGFYLIAGNSYIEAIRPVMTRPPLELHTLRPDRMKVIVGSDGPAGYEYKVSGSTKKWVGRDAKLVRHIKSFHPTNDWYGLSAVEPAAFDVDIHNATLEWNKSLLDNRAQPSGVMTYAPRNEMAPDFLPEEQFQRLKQELDEKYTGSTNSGRPMLLEGGLTWQQIGLSPQDMDYINSKNTTARDICMAFGVPPQLLGIPGDNTYANMKEARIALWEQTVLPLAYKIRDELNAWLAPMYGEDYRIVIDEDDILALASRRAEQWDKVEKASFLTINEKREAMGYEPVEGGDDILQPANLIPVGTSIPDNPKPTSEDSD